MPVAPYLPRTGVPYIPRPALEVDVVEIDAENVTVSATGILNELGGATMRVSVRVDEVQADGTLRRRVDNSEVIPTADSASADVFIGPNVTGPLRIRVLSSFGQEGLFYGVPTPVIVEGEPQTGKVVVEE